MVHSEVYLNKYVVIIVLFSTPAYPDCCQNIYINIENCSFLHIFALSFFIHFSQGSADPICPYVRTPTKTPVSFRTTETHTHTDVGLPSSEPVSGLCVSVCSGNEGDIRHHVWPRGGVRPVLDAEPRVQLPTLLVRHGHHLGLQYDLLEHGSPGVPRHRAAGVQTTRYAAAWTDAGILQHLSRDL